MSVLEWFGGGGGGGGGLNGVDVAVVMANVKFSMGLMWGFYTQYERCCFMIEAEDLDFLE